MKRLTTLTGPSCAGKSTLEGRLAAGGALRAVSTTTRAPRAGEIDGVHYYFVSKDKFLTMKHCEMFVESAKFGDHLYGVSTAELKRLHMAGDHVVVVCEPQGAMQIRQYCDRNKDIRLEQIFVDNPQAVIIKRFFERFLQDYESAKATGQGDAVNHVMDAYCQRAVIMGGVEKGWVAQAYSSAHPSTSEQGEKHFHYDCLIERFDASNINEIATILLAQTDPIAA